MHAFKLRESERVTRVEVCKNERLHPMYASVRVGRVRVAYVRVCSWVCFRGTTRMRADGKRTIAWGHTREETRTERSTVQNGMERNGT